MTAALARQCADDDGGHAALLLMDLDGFKDINDGLGHDVGDQLLVEIGHRLDRVTRADDVVARLGGDEFAVLLTRLATEPHAVKVAENLGTAHPGADPPGQRDPRGRRSASASPTAPPVTTLWPCSSGPTWPCTGPSASACGYAVYGSGDDEERRNSVKVAAELRTAIDHGDLVVHYQPKVEVATGMVDSVEALVRWEHPTTGPAAARRVHRPRRAHRPDPRPHRPGPRTSPCSSAPRWRSEGLDVPVAVNLSPRLLGQADLVPRSARPSRPPTSRPGA